MEERVIKVRKEQVGYGEEHYLGGMASYRRVVNKFIGNNIVLCNNIVYVDEEMLSNKMCGFEDYDEVYEQALKDLKEENKEELDNGEMTLQDIELMAEERAEYETDNYEFYQYYIIDISNWDLEYLQECGQKTLQICYSDKLDCYVLCVGHFGTGWDYVGSDFKLEVID